MNQFKIKLVKEEIDSNYEQERISSPSDAVAIAREFINDGRNDRECFVVICLSTKHQILGINLVSMGLLDRSMVTPSNVIKPALLSNSKAIICFHNHPSGYTDPSREDSKMTKRLRDACDLIGIDLLDHLIISSFSEDYYSFLADGDSDILNP
ncbi:MAG: JAB domain-containing protein [Halanaerobacter sp.]